MEIPSYLNQSNVVSVTLNFWPWKLDFNTIDQRIIRWFDRIIDFNLSSKFVSAKPTAKKGRNILHPHKGYPGWDVLIKATYEYNNKQWEFDYRYKQNSHYTSVRNQLCPYNLNEMWALLKSNPAQQDRAFRSLNEAFETSFSGIYREDGIHKSYGLDSDVWKYIQSESFAKKCHAVIEEAAESNKAVSSTFIKKMSKCDIDNLTDEEVLKAISSMSEFVHISMSNGLNNLKMMDFMNKISVHLADAKLTSADTVKLIRAARSIRSVHS